MHGCTVSSLVDELAEPIVGDRRGHRAIGRAFALAASPHQLIVYANVSGRIISLMSPGMSIMSTQAVVSAPDLQSPLAISPDGKALYVASTLGNVVRVVSTVTGHAGPPIGAGDHPVAMTVSPDGRTLYVANSDNTVTPISTTTRTAGAPIPVGRNPQALAVTPDGHYLYVANFGNNTVSQLPINGTGGR